MKIEKIIVGKGKSVPVNGPDGEWRKVFYELHATLDKEDNREQVRLTLEREIDQWLQEPDTSKIPQLDIAEISSFPWKTYERQPAGSWIFTDERRPPGSDKLIDAVTNAGGNLEIGEWKYTLSKDPSKPFLSRWPAKKKAK